MAYMDMRLLATRISVVAMGIFRREFTQSSVDLDTLLSPNCPGRVRSRNYPRRDKEACTVWQTAGVQRSALEKVLQQGCTYSSKMRMYSFRKVDVEKSILCPRPGGSLRERFTPGNTMSCCCCCCCSCSDF
jgi:hypothetical protein